jgi:DNA processing protein
MAERLACDLANRGLVIFSGLARSVDAAAHRGAVHAKGKTVAVFDTGVDIIYPKGKQPDHGANAGAGRGPDFRISHEHVCRAANFPIRNRIISGISIGVLVVEAAEYSGTRITSRCALEQNREVFAVPAT